MADVLVVADDLTGANAAAAGFARSGLRAVTASAARRADVVAEISAIFAKLAETKKANEEMSAKLATVEKELAEKTAILKDVEVRCKAAEDKAKKLEASMKDEGEKVIVASEAKVTEYIGKVDELLKMIEDVKKHGVVTVSGGGGGGAAPAAAGGSGPDAGGEPSSDFGFGSDAFATDKW